MIGADDRLITDLFECTVQNNFNDHLPNNSK